MNKKAKKFGEALTRALYVIKSQEGKKLEIIQDEIGFAIGKSGRYALEYWRQGRIPKEMEVLENLARELFRRKGLNCSNLEVFLEYADYPYLETLVAELCPYSGGFSPGNEEDDRNLSPFVVGVPIHNPKQFFGRAEILTEIFRLWRGDPLQSGAIVGFRRTGKTSLLHYIRNITPSHRADLRPGQRTVWLPPDRQIQWIFVDFQEPAMRHQETLLRYLLTSLKLPVPTPCTQTHFIQVVAKQLQERTVIMMDEIGVGLTLSTSELDQEFWGGMRALTRKMKGKLAFLLAAHARPDELAQDQGISSPFFNIFHYLNLGPFTEAETYDLISSSPIAFTPADKDWIFAQSKGWPNLVQILCYHRLAALEEGQSTEIWKAKGLKEISRFKYLLEA